MCRAYSSIMWTRTQRRRQGGAVPVLADHVERLRAGGFRRTCGLAGLVKALDVSSDVGGRLRRRQRQNIRLVLGLVGGPRGLHSRGGCAGTTRVPRPRSCARRIPRRDKDDGGTARSRLGVGEPTALPGERGPVVVEPGVEHRPLPRQQEVRFGALGETLQVSHARDLASSDRHPAWGRSATPQSPTAPSMRSRMRSACPLCRAYSSTMCTRIQRSDTGRSG